jgi:hypothetical protein
MNEGQEVAGGLLVAGCDAPVVFEAVDESLHEIAAFVAALVETPRVIAVAPRWNHNFGTALVDRLHQFVRIITLVSNHGFGLVLTQQFPCALHVVLLARPQTQLHRLALRVYRNVQLATEAATRPPERFFAGRFFWGEPAAC